MTTTKKLKWKKADDIPTAIDGEIVPSKGIKLGPVGVSKGFSGWAVIHLESGKLVSRGGFEKRDQAKHYAEMLLSNPDFLDTLENFICHYGEPKPGANWEALDAMYKFGRDYSPYADYWKSWKPNAEPGNYA